MNITRNQQEKIRVDFFNPNTGQVVRLDGTTGEFDTFINY